MDDCGFDELGVPGRECGCGVVDRLELRDNVFETEELSDSDSLSFRAGRRCVDVVGRNSDLMTSGQCMQVIKCCSNLLTFLNL